MGTLRRTVIGFVGIALLVACGGDAPPAVKQAKQPVRKPMLLAEAAPEPTATPETKSRNFPQSVGPTDASYCPLSPSRAL